MGLKFFHEHIRWDLENHIWDEEYRQRSVLLCVDQFQICDQSEGAGIRDVDSIEESQ